MDPFVIRKPESSNKTIRMSNILIRKLEIIAENSGVSFNQVVVQCCEYALHNFSDDPTDAAPELI